MFENGNAEIGLIVDAVDKTDGNECDNVDPVQIIQERLLEPVEADLRGRQTGHSKR